MKFTQYRRVKIATRRRGNLANIGRTKRSNEYDPASESLSMRMRAMGYAGGRQSDIRLQRSGNQMEKGRFEDRDLRIEE